MSIDLIDRLAGLTETSGLAALRTQRGEARLRTQASHDALLAPADPGTLPLTERAAVAARIATLNGDTALAAHYQGLAGEGAAPVRAAVLAHAELVTLAPSRATPDHLGALTAVGLDERGIVSLSQLIAFVNYQARLLAGLRLLDGQAAPAALPVSVSGPGPDPSLRFTLDVLDWTPWITPVALDAATPAQLTALEVTPSNTKIGAYSLVLAHDAEALTHRTPLFNSIMYAPKGLPRAERELATAVESVLNGCVYCASVHARRFAELTKEPEVVLGLYRQGVAAPQTPRRRAIVDFAAALSRTPPAIGAESLAALRTAGLVDLDILDLIHAVAIFAWANRLMLTLGEPAA